MAESVDVGLPAGVRVAVLEVELVAGGVLVLLSVGVMVLVAASTKLLRGIDPSHAITTTRSVKTKALRFMLRFPSLC